MRRREEKKSILFRKAKEDPGFEGRVADMAFYLRRDTAALQDHEATLAKVFEELKARPGKPGLTLLW